MWNPSAAKVKVSRDVIFNEQIQQVSSFAAPSSPSCDLHGLEKLEIPEGDGDFLVSHGNASGPRQVAQNVNEGEAENLQLEVPVDPFHGFEQVGSSGDQPRRSTRDRKKPERLIEDPNFLSREDASAEYPTEPVTYQDAITSPESEMWVAALEEETMQ